ncbi:MAG: NPCBM/NEW2 domain-containing protein [Planctomycetaceae bacterium]|nr:NPCBM/NEW2 domain-containing protein [Planctomycetaceae bacterium]
MKTFLSVLFLFSGTLLAFEPVDTALVKSEDKPIPLTVDVSGVADLYLVATYGGDSYHCDRAIWGEPTLFEANGNAVRLTTLKPADVKVGWGELYIDKNHQDNPLSIAGEKISFGYWTHAPSILHFKLDGKYTRFETKVGLDTGSGPGTTVFQIRDEPVDYPSFEEYTKDFPGTPPIPPPTVPPVEQTTFEFNAAAAKQLLDQGIAELLFIRRLTGTASHVYTEHVDSRWTPGGGPCVLDLKTGKVRDIIPELTQDGIVSWMDLSFDAKKIVFDCKLGANEGFRIYEVNVDGTNLRQLTFPEEDEAELVNKYRGGYHHGTDDTDPCYLPDGGIVFATTRCQFSVLCDSSDTFTVKNLYRMNGDGMEMRPLSYSALSEATPTILSDGRILYHRWEYVDKAAGNAKALWSMNPDGSGTAEVYGNSISYPETMIQAREVPHERNKIVMLGASHCCPNNGVGTVIVVDTSQSIRSPGSMYYVTDDVATFHHNGFHFKDGNGGWIHDMTGEQGRLFRNPYPISMELFLVSCKPKGLRWDDCKGYFLALLDGQGRETVLLKDSAVSIWHPFPLVPRERPPVLVGGVVDSELAAQGLARCVVSDIYVGMENVKRGDVKYIRILEQLPRPWSARKSYYDDNAGTTHAHSAVGTGSLSVKVQHGVVPVEDDGSAHFLVPARKAIYFQALDENFCAIQTERTYVNYNPGEVRSCIGCHETPDVAPPYTAAQPKAALRPASMPGPQRTQTDARLIFSYDQHIQPILDKHCIACHGEEKTESGLDLRGIPEATYSISYHALNRIAQTERQLLGFRMYRDEDAPMNDIDYIPPYQTGALSSPLGAMMTGRSHTSLNNPTVNQYTAKLAETHPDVKLSEPEKLIMTNWLDVNCQYHPSYWGRFHAKFKDEPNFRPTLSFEEVQELMLKR